MRRYSPNFGEVMEDFESVEIDGFVVRSTTIDLGAQFKEAVKMKKTYKCARASVANHAEV